jgi:hypothetical protein
MIRRASILAAIAVLTYGCTDGSPTGPSAGASGASPERAAAAASRSPRTVAPRASANAKPSTGSLLGTWGGDHINLTIGAPGALLGYDCAHGTIDQPFATDAQGRFNLVGTHTPENPGPTHEGPEPSHPASYTGATDGVTMTLTVTVTDTGQVLGPFTLTFGSPGHVVKCA